MSHVSDATSRLANAPCSFGYHGVTRKGVSLPDGETLLSRIAQAGYGGVDLGPHGLFGTENELVENLARYGLSLAGGWLDFPFSGSDDEFDRAVSESRVVLSDLALAGRSLPGLAPLPTIADRGDDRRRLTVGGGVALDRDTWQIFCRRVDEVIRIVRGDYGLEPTFHHHMQTYVETPAEIEALLNDTNIGLTFDTGHLLVGGGSLDHFAAWAERINHIHLKDVRTEVLSKPKGSGDPARALWEARVFVPLGCGDLNLAELSKHLDDVSYDGWIVIEQDVVIAEPNDVVRAYDEQRYNALKAKEMLS